MIDFDSQFDESGYFAVDPPGMGRPEDEGVLPAELDIGNGLFIFLGDLQRCPVHDSSRLLGIVDPEEVHSVFS